MILLRTTEESGASFIRTDQLDGETDWKLRLAIPHLQKLHSDGDLLDVKGHVYGNTKLLGYFFWCLILFFCSGRTSYGYS